MKNFILACIACIPAIFIYSPVSSQYYFYNEDYFESVLTWEVGISAGGMNCLTDLGGKKGIGRKFIKDINWNNTRACGSIFAAANYIDLLGARLELSLGQVKATDQVLKNDRSAAYGRFMRNQNFRSNIKELAFYLELYPLSIIKKPDENLPLLNPYIFAGIGSFSFSPETYYSGSWLNVAGLHTEGQGFKEYPGRKVYKLTQFDLPFGLGFRYEVSPVLFFHFEIIYRKLWTDYLDDVSKTYIDPTLFYKYLSTPNAKLAAKLADRRITTDPSFNRSQGDIRGNENNNDAFFSGTIKIGFILGRQRRF